ncbi:unnamed protein product [Toxocara canis]|uniref:t-SNARE coiled-coil homology domain-containing protein n=1 Tax=Toxocara canis TaxID=6265 RepID=A0A183TVK4_TOXCA|nr:unnamed protein product [Toxocara canis]
MSWSKLLMETAMAEVAEACSKGGDSINKESFELDVFVDIRRVLPLIRQGLIELNKLNEFIEDNEKCFNI